MPRELSIGAAAEVVQVSVETLRAWEERGLITPTRTPGGHRRYQIDELIRLKESLARKRKGRAAGGSSNDPPLRQRAAAAVRRMTRVASPAYEREPLGLPHEGFAGPSRAEPPSLHRHGQTPWRASTPPSNEQLAEESHLAMLRTHARCRIPHDASAAARSAVLEMISQYVTLARFPRSLPFWEASTAIDAKVDAVLEPFTRAAADAKAAAAAKVAATARAKMADELEQARLTRHRDSLIARGESRALFATTIWEGQDRQEARAEVHDRLTEEVEPDWTEQDVDELVDEILADWTEDLEH